MARSGGGNYRGLLELLASVQRYRIPAPSGAHDSMVEYDRRRSVKEMLLESIINTCVDTADAVRMIRAAMARPAPVADVQPWEEPMHRVLSAVMRGEASTVRKGWKELLTALGHQPLLYVSLARGGNPLKIVAARSLQSMLCRLLAYLPRLGLIHETAQLLETIQGMEFEHPQGPGAITEFDRVFQIGCKSIVARWSRLRPIGPRRRAARINNLSTTNLSPCWNRPPSRCCAAGLRTAGASGYRCSNP